MNTKELKAKIKDLVSQYYQKRHKSSSFEPGKSPVRYAGRVFDEEEILILWRPLWISG